MLKKLVKLVVYQKTKKIHKAQRYFAIADHGTFYRTCPAYIFILPLSPI